MEKKYSLFFINLTVVYCVCLIISNISAFKLVQLFEGFMFPAAVLLFPVTYITNDIFVEVYGYSKAKNVIWTGFLANLLAVLFLWGSTMLPSPAFFENSEAYKTVLSNTPRILAASLIAYLFGSFLNAFTVSKLKILTKGKYLALRLILSTVIGEGLDSIIFITAAFFGLMSNSELITMILTQAAIKIFYEIILYPLTRLIIKRVKKDENIDVIDAGLKSYNPFKIAKD